MEPKNPTATRKLFREITAKSKASGKDILLTDPSMTFILQSTVHPCAPSGGRDEGKTVYCSESLKKAAGAEDSLKMAFDGVRECIPAGQTGRTNAVRCLLGFSGLSGAWD